MGWISGVFGVRGEVRLHLHNRESEILGRWNKLFLITQEGERYRIRLKARSGAGKRILARIEGLDDRELAFSMQGIRIVIDKASLSEPDTGEFYVYQTVGLPVYVRDELVGTVEFVHGQGDLDVLEIVNGEDVYFVPCLHEYVVSLDPSAGRIELTPEAREG